MALRNILQDGEPALAKHSRRVTDFNRRLHELLDDLADTMEEAGGAGLAAPQVGVLRRVALVLETNVEEDEEFYIIELVNPEIIEHEGEQTGPEGCLSLPGEVGIVTRPERVLVRAMDRGGETFEVEGIGITARALCHEIDHLDGIMYTSLAERMLTPEEIEKLNKADSEENDEESGDLSGEEAAETEIVAL